MPRRKIPNVPLTAEQQALAEANTLLAPWWAERMCKRYSWWLKAVPMEDLVAACWVGVCQAARSYDPSRGAKFSTWAVWWMTSALQDAMGDYGTISLPRRVVNDAMSNRLDKSRLERVWLARRPLSLVVSGDSFYESGGGECTDELMPDRSMQAEEIVEQADEASRVHAALDRIHAREAQAVRLVFLEGKTLQVAGQEMGVTRERVRQLKERGLESLRKVLEAEGVTV